MTTAVTKESLIARIAELESGARSLKEDYTIAAYKMLLATMETEPDRNPVLAYADSYRDMAKQGVESVPIWRVITDLERNIAPLYSHAQPVPVTEREPIAWLNDAYLARGVVDGEAGSEDAGPGYIPVYREAQPAPVVPEDFDFNRFNDVVWLECVASNPHMHSPTTSAIARVALELNKRSATMEAEPVAYTDEEELNFVNDMACMWTKGMGINEVPLYRHAQPAPVVQDKMTAIVKDEAEYVKLERLHDAVSGNSPVIPDKWIPVSERVPEEGGRYWCYVEEQNSLGKSHYQWNCSWNGDVWSDKALTGRVTHWMPLPAAPAK